MSHFYCKVAIDLLHNENFNYPTLTELEQDSNMQRYALKRTINVIDYALLEKFVCEDV